MNWNTSLLTLSALLAFSLTAQAAQTTSYTYNSLGLIETIDGPRSDVSDITTYGYDAVGNLTSIVNALGHTTTITLHDASGRPLAMADSNGANTYLTYNRRGQITSQATEGRQTLYSYDLAGNLTQIDLGKGQVITYYYDDANRNTGYSDSLGNSHAYLLDDAGNITSEAVYDPSQTLTMAHGYVYDELSRLMTDLGADNQTTSLQYDVNNNLTSQIDPNTNTTLFNFDALDRLSNTQTADNGLTQYTYDGRDNLTSVTDPRGNTTSYTYDEFDNLTTQTSPDTGLTTYTYDDAGNRLTQTDARGVTVTYSYDALNRISSVSYPDSSLNVTYTYDENGSGQNGVGRLTSQTDASGTTQYSYDLRSNLLSQSSTRANISYTLDYSYNTTDQLTSITYPNGEIVTYSYDSAGNVSDITSSSGSIASNITYQPFGGINAYTYGNGLTLAQGYDLDARLSQINVSSVLLRDYGFDANSNITSITDGLGTNNQTLGYDNMNRLDSADGSYGINSYLYDLVHNRTSKTNSNTGTENYSYGSTSNQLDSTTSTTYQYDAVGNMTDNGTKDFIYGDDNRLHAVGKTKGQNNFTAEATYLYNAQGQRTQKASTITTGQGKNKVTTNVAIEFIYGQQGELLAEYDSQTGQYKNFIYLNGQPIAFTEGTDIYFIHTDHLGTPQTMTDLSQMIVWHANYSPFGEVTITTETVANNIRFPGQYADSETGLYYNYFRYYSPSLGRYITSDPIGLAGGINTYGYVGGNPLRYSDPKGLVLPALALPVLGVGSGTTGGGTLSALGLGGLIAMLAISNTDITNSQVDDIIENIPDVADDSCGKNCPSTCVDLVTDMRSLEQLIIAIFVTNTGAAKVNKHHGGVAKLKLTYKDLLFSYELLGCKAFECPKPNPLAVALVEFL